MPAAAVKGIIISISIIAALGVAVLENPQVQEWLEEQRKKIADLLRSIGEELDPASRRAAEAFAFEGRTPTSNIELTRETSGSRNTAEVATGRSLSNDTSAVTRTNTVRRIPVAGPSDPEQAEERRRKGREYLAKRNQQMIELRERRKATEKASTPSPPSPISFDEMVDEEGKLRLVDNTGESQSSIPFETMTAQFELTDPFNDENAVGGSETPRALRSPGLAPTTQENQELFDAPAHTSGLSSSNTVEERPAAENTARISEDTTYEEQMAIALSLSEAEQHARQMLAASSSTEDADLAAAIKASLREFEKSQATDSEMASLQTRHPLTLLEPTMFRGDILQSLPPPNWDSVLDADSRRSVSREGLTIPPSESDHDELYRTTPQLSTVPLALPNVVPTVLLTTLNSPEHQDSASETSTVPLLSTHIAPPHVEELGPLIDISDETAQRSYPPTLISRSATADTSLSHSRSISDVSASASDIWVPAQSHPQSDESDIEVIDVVEDSDIDMMSEADRTMTPDSWTDVGSDDGESEDSEIWSHRH